MKEPFFFIRRALVSCLILLNGLNSQATQREIVVSKVPISKSFPLVTSDNATNIVVDTTESDVVKTVAGLFSNDVNLVTDKKLNVVNQTVNGTLPVIIGTVSNSKLIAQLIADKKLNIDSINNKWERFIIKTVTNPFPGVKQALVIVGSDKRGTAYGVFTLSKAIGVSPWYWWADVLVKKSPSIYIKEINYISKAPSVKFRGIFLNDEDWGLLPWSTKNFEKETQTKYPIQNHFTGQVGPKTYEKIFELMLRLKANTIWPAMHEVTMPFYFVKGNREMAEKYGIIVSTSHCEPMMRNSATEWDLEGKGDYNYLTNKDSVTDYWSNRLKELGNSDNLFTIGMRGKHDGRMIGVKNTDEYKNELTKVIADQTELLKKYINPEVSKIPQQFVPYKEVLDVYRAGLEVPDYVTLVWPDDNHGYIRHYPTEKEQARSGGNGIYYHVSYWGVPHDNLWLGLVQPSLMYQQMKLAYEKNARTTWILNVGDIKPSEYLTEFFLDLAWDVNLGKESTDRKKEQTAVSDYLFGWLSREFGKTVGYQLVEPMSEFYLLTHIRKPEFMGTVQQNKSNTNSELCFTLSEMNNRLDRFIQISNKIKVAKKFIPENYHDAYFQLIEYPVLASYEMNKKWIFDQFYRRLKDIQGDEIRENMLKQSDNAFDSIVSLTKTYNSINSGKWTGMMDYQPRGLTVFQRVKHITDTLTLLPNEKKIVINARSYTTISGKYTTINGLGCSGNAIYLSKNCNITYSLKELVKLEKQASNADIAIRIEVRLVPTHAVEGKSLTFSVVLGKNVPLQFNYETAEFSPEWKENVLRSQAIKTINLKLSDLTDDKLKINAIDEGIVIDQIVILL